MPEKDNSTQKNTEKRSEVESGSSKTSFGDLFLQGISSLIDLVSRMEEEGKSEETGGGEFTTPSKRVKAVYGFSVKTGLGGRTAIEPFGNVKKTAQGPTVEDERQPLVDVFDEQDHVLVIAELPGVEEDQIHTEINGDILTLSAAGDGRKYSREVILPGNINSSIVKSSYKNGVLEIRIDKK